MKTKLLLILLLLAGKSGFAQMSITQPGSGILSAITTINSGTSSSSVIQGVGSGSNASITLIPKYSDPAAPSCLGAIGINSASIPSALQTWHNGGLVTPFDLVSHNKPGNPFNGFSQISTGDGNLVNEGVSAGASYWEIVKQGGTVAVPTAVGTNWWLGEIAVLGFNGTTFDAHVLMDFVTSPSNARSGEIAIGFAVNGVSPNPGPNTIRMRGTTNPLSLSVTDNNNTVYASITNTGTGGAAGWRSYNSTGNFLEAGIGSPNNTNALIAGSAYTLGVAVPVTIATTGTHSTRFAVGGLAASNQKMAVTTGGVVIGPPATAATLAAFYTGTVTLTAGVGSLVSANISTSSNIIATRTSANGAAVAPLVTVFSGSATLEGAGTDAGTYKILIINSL